MWAAVARDELTSTFLSFRGSLNTEVNNAPRLLHDHHDQPGDQYPWEKQCYQLSHATNTFPLIEGFPL